MVESVENRTIGQVVAQLRGTRSQEAVAAAMRARGQVKWSQTTVWSVETGTRPLRLNEAADLAAVLDADVTDFLADPATVALPKELVAGVQELRKAYEAVQSSVAYLLLWHNTVESAALNDPKVRAIVDGSTKAQQLLAKARSWTVDSAVAAAKQGPEFVGVLPNIEEDDRG
jgi:hypothetical protein